MEAKWYKKQNILNIQERKQIDSFKCNVAGKYFIQILTKKNVEVSVSNNRVFVNWYGLNLLVFLLVLNCDVHCARQKYKKTKKRV